MSINDVLISEDESFQLIKVYRKTADTFALNDCLVINNYSLQDTVMSYMVVSPEEYEEITGQITSKKSVLLIILE